MSICPVITCVNVAGMAPVDVGLALLAWSRRIASAKLWLDEPLVE